MKLRETIFKTGSRARVLSAAVLVCLSVTLAPIARAAPPAGPKAVKIIFKQAFPGGSFDASPATGTVNAPGSGQKAMRVFNNDGTLLAQGGSSASAWPKWLTDFEIGISGTSNEGAVNPACARFAGATESTALCAFDGAGAADVNCGAMQSFFRISEYDCTNPAYTPAVTGKGGPQDGVYFRATFSRNPAYLARTENISAVIEYSAASLDAPSPDPTKCFPNGLFNPAQSGCSDQVWQTYLKHSAYELTQPFLMLVPPATAYRDKSANTGGGIFTTRQFFLPLASDPALTVLQISRIKSINNVGKNTEDFCKSCSAACGAATATTAANSPHCLGIVVNSITFTRM